MSSEETRKPRSMKKLSVVCHAGPRSSSVPCPSPSKFHKSSFSPFDIRVEPGASGGLGAPTAGDGPTLRVRPVGGVWRETSRLEPVAVPIPSLWRKLMDQSAAVPEFTETGFAPPEDAPAAAAD